LFVVKRLILSLRAHIALLVWVTALATGFGCLISYELKPGVAAAAPTDWPAAAGLEFDAQRHNLVLFAHPQCPCTRASLAELEVVFTRCRQEVKPTICFIYPASESANVETSLVRAARRIPGLTVVIDHGGAIAARFGAMTSGQALLFDRQQKRVFSGGITGSRGHEGDNLGRTLLMALVRGEICTSEQTPVYGCALHDTAQTK
jgi:hypothetical protein